MAEEWRGKHLWIWQLEKSGDPGEIVKKSISLGLAGLIVKAWDGGNYWSQIEKIAGLAREAGLVVGAWGYSYGTNIKGELNAAKRAAAAGADWLVVDAEVEYENKSGVEKAKQLGDAFRNSFSELTIGYTTFAIAQYHPGFPYKEFTKWCNVVLPQVYWGEFKMAVNTALAKTLPGLISYGLPIAPIGQTFSSVLPEEIILFGRLAKKEGLSGISFWDWQSATPGQLNAVGSVDYPKEGKPVVSDYAKESWEKAVAKGILDGTNPQGVITREMGAVILDRLGLLDYSTVPQEMVDELKKQKLITNDHPTRARITWGEFSTVILRLLNKTK
ncbi:hypothetical protein SAMN05660649_00533 [Desulfotomaculum arcticum]|uniref:Uncharacterized protein n=1 Tax=Desulfotruncus arcticus DSM 17038 TaxID=1121424 RepID=A0A1I2NRP5_9FIRM|nr:hypothetical protein [Desulfotruncus arcticus]SFG06398.1 hypothetical protein SAMN05660649_00533 [Desulfotomaculum arcticum] [Desulfotruncus arcticus DSM 17038]